jgi:hypothetical protein
MRQGVGIVHWTSADLFEVYPEHRQEVPGGTDPWRLHQRPEKGLDFGGATSLLHAGVVVLRIGGRLAGLQIRLIERFGGPGRVFPLLVGPRLLFEPALAALGAAEDLRALGWIRMVVPQVVLAGGVSLVRSLGVEDSGRRQQENAEKGPTRDRSAQAHEFSASVRSKIRRGGAVVNSLYDDRLRAARVAWSHGEISVRAEKTRQLFPPQAGRRLLGRVDLLGGGVDPLDDDP